MSDTDKTRIIETDLDRTRMVAPPEMDRAVLSEAPVARQSLTLAATTGNEYGLTSHYNREHILFDIRARGGSGARLPLNIALVIDRSGSMEGEPLEYAKRACSYVVDLLEPNDILSVITFEEQADVIMPARRVVNKALVKEYINRIYAGNTTNLYDGLMLGCQQVASVKSQNTLNRVLLLTDGEPTAGTKDYSGIIGQVAEQKARGITVTALGFGPDYNEELMTGIARRVRRQLLSYRPARVNSRSVSTRTGHFDANHLAQLAAARTSFTRRDAAAGLWAAADVRQSHGRSNFDGRGARLGPFVALGVRDFAKARPGPIELPSPSCFMTMLRRTALKSCLQML